VTPDQNWDCLCAGIVVADFFCDPIPQFPPPGGLILTDSLHLTIGGCAANVAVDLARLGRRVTMSASVGDDLFGRAVCDMLARDGVDISSVQSVAGVPTSGTFVINVRGEDRRFIHCVGSNGVYDGSQITREQLGRCRSLYVGGYGLLESLTPEAVMRLFRTARELRVPTLLDVVLPAGQDFAGAIAPVLPFTDVFLPNTDEAAVLLGEADPARQAREFLRLGARTVIVTCGADGAVIGNGDGLWKCSVYPVEAVDATGTGDAFVAGFIHSLLEQRSLGECIRAGAAMGASCVRTMGATTGVFSADELAQFLATHPLPLTEI
jgi:sugar/nucleoside kinase (ribokinase family)